MELLCWLIFHVIFVFYCNSRSIRAAIDPDLEKSQTQYEGFTIFPSMKMDLLIMDDIKVPFVEITYKGEPPIHVDADGLTWTKKNTTTVKSKSKKQEIIHNAHKEPFYKNITTGFGSNKDDKIGEKMSVRTAILRKSSLERILESSTDYKKWLENKSRYLNALFRNDNNESRSKFPHFPQIKDNLILSVNQSRKISQKKYNFSIQEPVVSLLPKRQKNTSAENTIPTQNPIYKSSLPVLPSGYELVPIHELTPNHEVIPWDELPKLMKDHNPNIKSVPLGPFKHENINVLFGKSNEKSYNSIKRLQNSTPLLSQNLYGINIGEKRLVSSSENSPKVIHFGSNFSNFTKKYRYNPTLRPSEISKAYLMKNINDNTPFLYKNKKNNNSEKENQLPYSLSPPNLQHPTYFDVSSSIQPKQRRKKGIKPTKMKKDLGKIHSNFTEIKVYNDLIQHLKDNNEFPYLKKGRKVVNEVNEVFKEKKNTKKKPVQVILLVRQETEQRMKTKLNTF